VISNQQDDAVPGARKSEQPEHEISTDHDLLVAANAGCENAFTELFDRHNDDLMHYLLRQTSDVEQAEDLAQETFVDTLRSLGEIPEDRPFKGWLFRTARNNFLNDARRQRVRRAFSFERLMASTKRTRREM
jgi:RNA polymerase sigma-70 factor (ECF subfamily)